jgi:hypothetical protein
MRFEEISFRVRNRFGCLRVGFSNKLLWTREGTHCFHTKLAIRQLMKEGFAQCSWLVEHVVRLEISFSNDSIREVHTMRSRVIGRFCEQWLANCFAGSDHDLSQDIMESFAWRRTMQSVSQNFWTLVPALNTGFLECEGTLLIIQSQRSSLSYWTAFIFEQCNIYFECFYFREGTINLSTIVTIHIETSYLFGSEQELFCCNPACKTQDYWVLGFHP